MATGHSQKGLATRPFTTGSNSISPSSEAGLELGCFWQGCYGNEAEEGEVEEQSSRNFWSAFTFFFFPFLRDG
jgi:hypothetical protein